VDIRQKLHLEQVFYIAKVAGWLNETELFHAANGFISLKDGAMSTRTGKIIRLEALLDEAESRAEKIILEKRQDIEGAELKNLSKTIGIGAIKY
jgi:arginyl-tRNA synthetase